MGVLLTYEKNLALPGMGKELKSLSGCDSHPRPQFFAKDAPYRTLVMSKEKGRYLPVSPFRRLVADLMSFSQQVPTVTVERYMDLAELAAARQALFPRPTW